MDKGVFVKVCENMILELFEIMEMKFEEFTEFDRQLLSMLSFGMISAYGMKEKMGIDIVGMTAEYVLTKNFKYSKEQSKTFLNLLIDSTKKGKNPTYYRIIHEGIEMYYEYIDNEKDKIFDRTMKIYLSFNKK